MNIAKIKKLRKKQKAKLKFIKEIGSPKCYRVTTRRIIHATDEDMVRKLCKELFAGDIVKIEQVGFVKTVKKGNALHKLKSFKQADEENRKWHREHPKKKAGRCKSRSAKIARICVKRKGARKTTC